MTGDINRLHGKFLSTLRLLCLVGLDRQKRSLVNQSYIMTHIDIEKFTFQAFMNHYNFFRIGINSFTNLEQQMKCMAEILHCIRLDTPLF